MLTVDDIITRIADLTDSKGWTMIRLCKESNIPYGVFNRFLKGDKMISINNLQKICKAFDITLSQFFSSKQSLPNMVKVSDLSMFDSYLKLDDKYKNLVIEVIETLTKTQEEEKKENNCEQ